MTRRQAPARARRRGTNDPYGVGPVAGYVGPALAAVALVLIAIVTVNLLNFQLPFRTTSNGNGDPGPATTPAPSNVVIPEPKATFPGTIAFAKAGNIWLQTATSVRQLTDGGRDSMPAFSPDGSWIYFIRTQDGRARFPIGGNFSLQRAWYDLSTPSLMRVKPDGSGTARLLQGRFVSGTNAWFYWIRQPTPGPDGRTIALISDGPNPLQSNIVLQTYDLTTKKLTSLGLPESGSLGHQDPAWSPDGKALLYIRNGRELSRGAPQIFRYEVTTKKTRALTGPGYLAPSYSPDGRLIAATKTDAFGTDVAILDSAGKEILRVTTDGHSFSPIWSPAGDSVAYLHLAGTIVDLRLARLDAASGRWVVTETLDLTKVSGLDGSSRPGWFVPASELPARSPEPSRPAVPASSGSSAAP